MIVEVWQRGSIGTDAVDSMYGVAKLPLHQFHIAFHDINVRLHVSKQKVSYRRIRMLDSRLRKTGTYISISRSCQSFQSMVGQR